MAAPTPSTPASPPADRPSLVRGLTRTRPHGGLRRNLVGTVVTAIGTLIFALLLLEDPLVEHRVAQLAQETIGDAMGVALERLDQGLAPDVVADLVGAETHTRITILGAEGVVVGDSGLDGDALATATGLVHEEAYAAFLAGRRRASRSNGVHVAFERHGDLVVQVVRSTALSDRVHETVRELLVIGGLMAALVAIFLTLVLGRTLIEPAKELTQVADALAAGDLSARSRSERDDELGAIGRALDRMADQLADRIENLHAEQDRLRTVLNSMVEAVFVTDSLGRIIATNQALDRLLGADVLGLTAMEALKSPELHDAVRTARKGEPCHVELEIRLGDLYSFSAHVAPLQAGAGVVAVLHDVSKLRETDRLRRDFVANASHELRTPLTAIRGFAETLRDGALEDPDAARRFLDVILRHTLRLQALVADLTALSRAESPDQHLELEDVDVGRAAMEVVRGLSSKAEQRRVQLVFEPPPATLVVHANERGLDQVLINLVDNAIKYTPEGTSVRVRVRDVDDHVRLDINNPGPPIAPQHLERVFERFYRIDEGRSRDVGGTGLGLSIVKHLCAQMGAEVKVQSNDADGTTFSVLFPTP
ncbi:MAG: HAMP domain-containing protein [Myxococcales bacterium]|nr:HAMP domain-containing protein [Myxococcales bacterium]